MYQILDDFDVPTVGDKFNCEFLLHICRWCGHGADPAKIIVGQNYTLNRSKTQSYFVRLVFVNGCRDQVGGDLIFCLMIKFPQILIVGNFKY